MDLGTGSVELCRHSCAFFLALSLDLNKNSEDLAAIRRVNRFC